MGLVVSELRDVLRTLNQDTLVRFKMLLVTISGYVYSVFTQVTEVDLTGSGRRS